MALQILIAYMLCGLIVVLIANPALDEFSLRKQVILFLTWPLFIIYLVAYLVDILIIPNERNQK